MSSGDDIEAGRVTTAESTTNLIAAIPSEQNVGFNGAVIFRVAPQDGDLHPPNTLDAIHGVGSNASFSPGVPGGAGVVGFGGPNRGTGVRAVAGGGGVGLEAVGGKGGVITSLLSGAPGAGMITRGGALDAAFLNETTRTPNGPGAVAIAGGASLEPDAGDVGNAGMFAQGGDAVADTTIFDSYQPPIIVGAEFAGAGIVGRGGLSKSNNGVPNAPVVDTGYCAAGVVGIAGDSALPSPTSHYGAGVYGVSSAGAGVSGEALSGNGVAGMSAKGYGVVGFSAEGSGIRGSSSSGPGVSGDSARERGAIFGSSSAPQLHLVPLRIAGPTALSVEPRPGDFLVTTEINERGTEVASLHFCVSVGSWVKLA